MNRAERRAAARLAHRGRLRPKVLAAAFEHPGCPDCTAEQHLTEDAPGVYVLTVTHDDTCPALAARHRTHLHPTPHREDTT